MTHRRPQMTFSRQRFYWDTLEKDVRYYVHWCKRCVVSKALEPLVSTGTSAPLQLVCIDFWFAEDLLMS